MKDHAQQCTRQLPELLHQLPVYSSKKKIPQCRFERPTFDYWMNRNRGKSLVKAWEIDMAQEQQTVARSEWLAARRALLEREKELTRMRDEIRRLRQELPWEKVEKEYRFESPGGEKTLAELFEGRSQLIIQHFMFGPEWEEGCVGCSFHADHVDGANQHLMQHDVTFTAVSRAPLSKITAFKKRMGWSFPWVSSFGSDFNYDFQVSFTPEQLAQGKVLYNYEMTPSPIDELHGLSVFYKGDDGGVFHTYSSYGRGNEEVLGAYVYLDITPKGRNENGPNCNLTDWVRHHDRYGKNDFVESSGRKRADGCGCSEESVR